jgi:hypothetical protein
MKAFTSADSQVRNRTSGWSLRQDDSAAATMPTSTTSPGLRKTWCARSGNKASRLGTKKNPVSEKRKPL